LAGEILGDEFKDYAERDLYVAALVPGILIYAQEAEAEVYVAVDEGKQCELK
jgi:hypothetical protein